MIFVIVVTVGGTVIIELIRVCMCAANIPIINWGKFSGSDHTVSEIAAGGDHTCALLDNAKVKCFGKGNKGALGVHNGKLGSTPETVGYDYPSCLDTVGAKCGYVDLGTGKSICPL